MKKKNITKKPYQAPVVKRVHLQVKNAVLAACRTSAGLSMGVVSPCDSGAGSCFTTV
jgi:hypothetical protein